MWRELICGRHPTLERLGDTDAGPEFFSGATPEELADAERRLDIRLPGSLRDLLAETNGALVVYGTHLIWPVSEIVNRNLEMRTTLSYQESYMPFDHLLFFGDVEGYPFAFGIIQGEIKRERIYQ
jgi:hypothetical protein